MLFDRELASIQEQITSNTYRLFSISNWDEFSNGSKTSGSTANSLESIHGQMHNWIGGFGKNKTPPGHMSSVPVAGKLFILMTITKQAYSSF